ncbi:MAG TPA: VWA domain-containing protein [Candidatus Solibacter sp.]|nr:VWA domain-containing protein [Candidatus Solibacter sp.]
MKLRDTSRFGMMGLIAAVLAVAQPGASNPTPQGDAAGAGKPQAAPSAPTKPVATSGPQSGAAAPVVRATTRLVQVTVVAHHKGAPVADLTQEDFHVFDNGQEQKVQFFTMETGHVVEGTPTPLPANTWSNRTETRKGIPVNVTLILYDGLNTRVTDQNYAREQIIRFLSQIHPEDRVALYALGKDLKVLHDFTSDASSLLRVISKYKGYNGVQIVTSDPEVPNEYDTPSASMNEFLAGADEAFAQFQTVTRVETTVNALEAIAAHVAGIPGRKNLIWISGSFPFTMGYDSITAVARMNSPELQNRDFSQEIQRAARALTDANVAVYPVHAKGLVINATPATRNPQPYRRSFSDASPNLGENDLELQTLDKLAERTGGRAFYRTNDLGGAIRRAIEDSQVTYTLAYVPSHNEWNGKFRTIKVTTKRPGVELRYRTGYFAMPDKPLEPAQSEQMAYEAQWSSLEATELGLTVHAVRSTYEGRPVAVFSLTVDSAGLRFTEEEGRHSTNLLMILAQKAEDGHVISGDSKTLALRLKDDTYQTAMMKGLGVTGTLLLDPATTRFRLVMLDQSTGRLGSVDVPVQQLKETPAKPGPPAAPAATSPPTEKPPEKP